MSLKATQKFRQRSVAAVKRALLAGPDQVEACLIDGRVFLVAPRYVIWGPDQCAGASLREDGRAIRSQVGPWCPLTDEESAAARRLADKARREYAEWSRTRRV